VSSTGRRVLASFAAWLTGAVVAVAVGLLALSLIGTGLTDREVQPLPHDPAAGAALAGPTTAGPANSMAPATASPSAAPALTPSVGPTGSPSVGSVGTLMAVPGGTVIARCVHTDAYLVSWSPDQGYHVQDVVRGPAPVVRVEFDSRDRDSILSVRCVDGLPQGRVGGSPAGRGTRSGRH
jgi:hypothetical protein